MATTKVCVECEERKVAEPHLALNGPKGSGRVRDTCAEHLLVLVEEGVDITQDRPKPVKVKAEKAATTKVTDRQRKMELIQQRAESKKRREQQAEDGEQVVDLAPLAGMVAVAEAFLSEDDEENILADAQAAQDYLDASDDDEDSTVYPIIEPGTFQGDQNAGDEFDDDHDPDFVS